jgi:hypothetical protein
MPLPPLLDQPEGVEDATHHAVAQLRDAAAKVLDREAEGQQTVVLDLQTAVEDGHPDGGAPLRVVRVGHRVDHRLSHRGRRQAPAPGRRLLSVP